MYKLLRIFSTPPEWLRVGSKKARYFEPPNCEPSSVLWGKTLSRNANTKNVGFRVQGLGFRV